MIERIKRLSCIALAATTLSLPSMSFGLAIGATPLATQEETEALYAPLAEKLTEVLGQEVVFSYSEDWLAFSKRVLASDFDIIVSEPHIIAYVTSITSVLSMQTVASFAGDLEYHVITSQDSGITDINSLQSQRICMLPSPNFSGVLIMKEFVDNPVTQPTVHEVRGNFDNVFQKFKDGRCKAAIIDDDTYQRMSRLDDSIVSVHKTPKSPNVGVAISQRIPSVDRAIIEKFLVNNEALGDSQALFDKYAKGKLPFERAQNESYEKMNILPGVVWGW